MDGDSRSGRRVDRTPDLPDCPAVSVCESRPGVIVFLESGNTDGWIASDTTVDAHR
jgi:hypothetical protein